MQGGLDCTLAALQSLGTTTSSYLLLLPASCCVLQAFPNVHIIHQVQDGRDYALNNLLRHKKRTTNAFEQHFVQLLTGMTYRPCLKGSTSMAPPGPGGAHTPGPYLWPLGQGSGSRRLWVTNGLSDRQDLKFC